ncbi:hypothetical protein HJC23_005845 [Cyclotella cryptica]|uniref:Uncharacterized protein n=1 Tax=Cyclotella cryptica TaxID=29204 RepID=A0ABD3R468_9STRA
MAYSPQDPTPSSVFQMRLKGDDETPFSLWNNETDQCQDEHFVVELFEPWQRPRRENGRWYNEEDEDCYFRTSRCNKESTKDGFLSGSEPIDWEEVNERNSKGRTPLKSLTNTLDHGESSRERRKHLKNNETIPTATLGTIDECANDSGGENTCLYTLGSSSNSDPTVDDTDKNVAASFSDLIGITRPVYETTDNYGVDPSCLFGNFVFPSIKKEVNPEDSLYCSLYTEEAEDSPRNHSASYLLSDGLSVIEECDEETDSEDASVTSDCNDGNNVPLYHYSMATSMRDFDSEPIFSLSESKKNTHIDCGARTPLDDEKVSAKVNDPNDTFVESRRLQRALGPLLGNNAFHNKDIADYYVDESFYNDQDYPACPSIFSECFLNIFASLFLGKRQYQGCVMPVDCCAL